MTSIFEGQPPKARPKFHSKEGAPIWVPMVGKCTIYMDPYGVWDHLQNLRVKPRAMGLQAAPLRSVELGTQLGVFSIMGSELKEDSTGKNGEELVKRDQTDKFLWKMDLFRSWVHFEDGVFEKSNRFFEWSCSIANLETWRWTGTQKSAWNCMAKTPPCPRLRRQHSSSLFKPPVLGPA